MKSLVLIPCYNTHQYLNKLLNLIRLNTKTDILVYDDGSSPALNFKETEFKNVTLFRNDTNKGNGNVIKKGIKYAIENNYSHIISIDGDMQHNPNEIMKFISCEYSTEFVLGYRKFKFPMPLHRILSNSITSFTISILKGKKILDSQCGYRRYSLSCIKLDKIKEDGYLIETELLLKCMNKKSIVKNLPIETIYGGSKSYMNKTKETLNFIILVFKYIVA